MEQIEAVGRRTASLKGRSDRKNLPLLLLTCDAMRHLHRLVLLLALSCPIKAFVAPSNRQGAASIMGTPFSSREEEIAKLEEQLRKLKEEQVEEGSVPDQVSSPKNARKLEKVQGKDIFLSEQALYEGNIVEDQSTEGNVVQTALAAVAAVLFLAIFSQIPIGQEDLSKYSVAPTSIQRTIDLGDLNPDAPKP